MNREFVSKNGLNLLILASTEIKPKDFSGFHKLKALSTYLQNGYCVLINMAIKEGSNIWLNVIKSKLVPFIFEHPQIFFGRINDYIRRSGCGMKSLDSFVEAKEYLMGYTTEEEKEARNLQVLLKNIAILSLNKEVLLNTIIQFYSENLLDAEKAEILNEELRRKKWEFESDDTYRTYIYKIKEMIEKEPREFLRDEFKNILYELSNTVRFIFILLKSLDYKDIDIKLIKKAIGSIYEWKISDFCFIIKDLGLFPSSLKEEIIDPAFYDKLRTALRKIPLPFEDKDIKESVEQILLDKLLFENGSLDYVKEFIKNKPEIDDMIYIFSNLIIPQKYVNDEKNYNEIWKYSKNYFINHYTDIYELIKNFSSLLNLIEGNEDLKVLICDEFWMTINQRYSLDVFLGLTHLFNKDSNSNFENNIMLSYTKFVQRLVQLLNPSGTEIPNYEKINHFFQALTLPNEEGEKVIISNNQATEEILISLLELLKKGSNPSKIVKHFIFETPSRESFWFKLLKATGKFTAFISREYNQLIHNEIQILFQKIRNGSGTVNDLIMINKQTPVMREAMVNFFEIVSQSSPEEINNIIEEQLKVLCSNLAIISNMDHFFGLYGNKIDIADDCNNYLIGLKKQYNTIEFSKFEIREDLMSIRSEVEMVNRWVGTIMFRNIFDQDFNDIMKVNELKRIEQNKTNQIEEKLSKIEGRTTSSTSELNKPVNFNVLPLKEFLNVAKDTTIQIKKILDNLLNKEDFSKLNLSTTMKYWKGLVDFTTESNIINDLINLDEKQHNNLKSILKTFCEITNYIKFSSSMLKLDSTYLFKSSNSKVYTEFLEYINNQDSSFDKIFATSKSLADIRMSYLAERDIENILFELADDTELIEFLLKTPEDDIRNMVDAVDEHGDSFIRVQTIRDVLIIGSFLRNLSLKDYTSERDNNLTEAQFIMKILDAFSKVNYGGIDVLLNTSNKQVLGIKHLHHELSNREEASKIKAKEIAKASNFEFVFSDKDNKKTYDVFCTYGKSKKKIAFRDLCDLRDRVLLLVVNEKDKEGEQNEFDRQEEELREVLKAFVKVIEISEKIMFVLIDIYNNGYPVHLNTSLTLENGNVKVFTDFLQDITQTNNTWNEDLKEAYSKYYPLTYYHGNQFWELEKIFNDDKKEEKNLVNSPGLLLVKYAYPKFNIADVKNNLYTIQHDTPKERILKLGEVLQRIIDVNENGKQKIDKMKTVQLNLKNKHFVFSTPSTLRIYQYLLSIHFSLESALPGGNQTFYCTKNTTFHEIISFLYRFVYCPVNRLFSILRVESLSFELQNYLVEQVNRLSKKNLKSVLSIICCDSNSFIATQFSESNFVYIMRDFDILDDLLIANTLNQLELNATVIRSDDTGAGKTFWIKKQQNSKINQEYIDFPILDNINIARINEDLFKLNLLGGNKLIHLTICGIIDDYEMLDFILFNFIILGCLYNDIYVVFRDKKINPIYIEVANTFNDYLFNAISILPMMPKSEMIIASENIKTIEVGSDVKDLIQVVCNYLENLDKGYIDDTDISPEINQNMRIMSQEECLAMLEKYFIKGNPDITFRQLFIFINVLSDQLFKYSNNYYFSVENIGYIQDEKLADIRSKIMNCLLLMTEEFTSRSIKSARDAQNLTTLKLKRSYSREEIGDNEKRTDEINALDSVLSWSSSNHTMVMFHEDGMCVTPVYREADKVNPEVMEFMESQRNNLENYQDYAHLELLEKLLNIVGKQFMLDFIGHSHKYILTADNFLKMILIIIRSRCHVPIVIMGETGCGKTSLVKFLSTEIMQEGFETINFHAGVKEEHIINEMNKFIPKAIACAPNGNKLWVFLDEINTCDSMGLITEIICQNRMKGRLLPDNMVFIAACNPYKLRKKKVSIGLIKQRVQSRLVYTVHPLPDSLIDYVWDFGSLSEKEETLYIGNILLDISGDVIKEKSIEAVCQSQIFIRSTEDRFSVSLRDVARFKILHEWFYKVLKDKNEIIEKEKIKKMKRSYVDKGGYKATEIKYLGQKMVAIKSLILSLVLCYYNRISKNSDRQNYFKIIANVLNQKEKEKDFITVKQIEEMINEEQRDIITRMELPPAIAINKALLENVFTLLVCIINKIPIFICGKPGCSKSLSVQLLVSNLRGDDSNDPFFKKLPRLLAIPYQGSESSTSEGIEKIFEKAKNVLKNNEDNSILPLIVFDEIGLAEISKNNPLKILHSLLEPEKAELAFVGISNWRLDASKMNRAVYLARPDPDLEDLENTALSIFEYYIKEPRFDERNIMRALAKTYFEFKKEQTGYGNPDFHGTRDFYSLIKHVTREFNAHYQDYNELKYSIVKDALIRNFGGLPKSTSTILKIFVKNLNLSSEFNELEKKNVITLIQDNLKDKDGRFLLLFTNGESAGYILDNCLKGVLKEKTFIIGSEFENDKDKDEYSFKLLSDIILYMESGNSIILKNLDQIYGSLYDLFNQNFMIVGQKKNCRIALGSTNNPMCFVNNNFHCVVLVDIKNLEKMDPPFLNRFEKQILTFDSILSDEQKQIVKGLQDWIHALTTISSQNQAEAIAISDMIITYNEEFVPSIVLVHYSSSLYQQEILDLCKRDVLSVCSINLIVYSILSEMYQTSRDEVLKTHKIFFDEQNHDSLNQYLTNVRKNEQRLIVYTNSNILDELRIDIEPQKQAVMNVAELKSEKDFDSRFKIYLNNPEAEWLIIKIDGVKEKCHIPMIKFKIDKIMNEFKKTNEFANKSVMMIIYLSKAIGAKPTDHSKVEYDSHFLSGWDQVMIDCLNGGQIDNLKTLLDSTTMEVIKKNLDQKSIAEMVFDIYLKFNFTTHNQNDNNIVKLYITELIHKIENDVDLFEIITKKVMEFLEKKSLGDWKVKICCDQKILSKSINTFTAIKLVVQEMIEEPILKIIHYLETESALNSYFSASTKAPMIKQIWKEQFDKKDLKKLYPYTALQSLNISPIFDLIFPFSKTDIYEISLLIKDRMDRIYMLDSMAYLQMKDLSEDSKIAFYQELDEIKKSIKKASVLFKILNKYNERYLEICYFNDIVTYFLIVELKKEFKWKNTLDIIVQRSIGCDVEHIEFVFIFLWNNRKTLDILFNVLNSLTKGICEVSTIEGMLNNEKLYDKNISDFKNIYTRRESENNCFKNIFNSATQVLLSKINEITKITNYAEIINTFLSSLMNFSLESKETPESLNILMLINEFLKLISNFNFYLEEEKEDLVPRVKDMFADEYYKIDLRDFSILSRILKTIDEDFEKIKNEPVLKKKVPKFREDIISGKITIFENVIIGKCDNQTKELIIKNIFNDDDLTMNSSMIFKRLYEDIKIDERFENLMTKNKVSEFIESILLNKDVTCITANFLTDFYRKFLKRPSNSEATAYLKQAFPNFQHYMDLFKKKTSRFTETLGLAGIKHYLEYYGRYLAISEIKKDEELSNKVNTILESTETITELLRNFVLKSMASALKGNAQSLLNVNYTELGVKWVSNNVFENNSNALGLEPNLPEMEKHAKEYAMFFVSLLNEDNEENLNKFKNIILAAEVKQEVKFILIQFFINKIYLSYSNNKFLGSFTLSHIIKIVDLVSSELRKSLGDIGYNFVYNLTHNFPNNPYLRISHTIDASRTGMISLMMQMFNMVLCFPNLCYSKLYYNDKNEMVPNFNHWTDVIYLPGGFADFHDENLLVMMRNIDENFEIYGTKVGLYECGCGFLYTIGDCTQPYFVSQCPMCKAKIGGMGHQLEHREGHVCLINSQNRRDPKRKEMTIEHLAKKLKNKGGFISKMADELSIHWSIRGMKSIGFRFLNFFNHAILYMMLENKAVTETAIENLIQMKDVKIKGGDYVFKHISTDIAKVSDLIKSKEYYILMHVFLNEFYKMTQDKYSFYTNKDREKFEIGFQTRVIDPKVDRIAGDITEYKQFFNLETKLTYLSIIDENYSDDDIKTLNHYEYYKTFRYTRLGMWDDLKMEFKKKKMEKYYQFLKLLIDKIDEISYLAHLYPIITFTNYIQSLCNYRFTRAEAKEMKIKDIVAGNEAAEKLFFEFAESWKKIGYKVTQYGCKQLPPIDVIDLDMPLSFVLVDDRELGYGMYMAASFQYLGLIQNEVLEAIVYLIKENDSYQIWGSMDTHRYQIQKVSSHEILMYHIEEDYVASLTEAFSKFYDIFNPNYGDGLVVNYNFEKIENELAFKLLTNKKFVNYEDLNKIQYKFELLSIQNKHSNLLEDIKLKLEQNNLNIDDLSSMRKALDKIEQQNVAYLHQIFSSLEIVLCNIRYSPSVENTTISNFVMKMQGSDKISPYLKETQPICGLLLSNILAFYEIMEDRIFKYMVEYISPDYQVEINEHVQGEIVSFMNTAYADLANYPSADQIINVLQRFIIRCLVATLEPKFPLKEYMNRVDFWDLDVTEDQIDNLYFYFPDEISVANTLSLLDFMREYKKMRLEEKEKFDLMGDKAKLDQIRQEMFKKKKNFL